MSPRTALIATAMLISHSRYSVRILLNLPNRILGLVLSSWHRGHIQDTLVLSRPRKRVQTRSRPSISDKYRKDLNWTERWGSGAGPASISSSCWWPGAEGNLSIPDCVRLPGGGGGCVLYGELFLWLSSEPRLLSFRLAFGMASIRAGTGRGSRLHTCQREQLWSDTTSLVRLKEKEKPTCPPPPFTLHSSSNPGRQCSGQAFL